MIDSFKVIVAVSFAQSGLLRKATEAQMSFGASDVIQFKDLNTGGNSAGNGGDGYNKGTLTSSQSANFSPYNKAYGSHVDVDTGDHVKQKAYWDAGDANGGKAIAKKGKASADGGKTSSDGSQSSDSGENVSKVYADTTAHQTNWAKFDQTANLIAGNGGDGGNGNLAKGGDVSFALVHDEVNYTELKGLPIHAYDFSADDHIPA